MRRAVITIVALFLFNTEAIQAACKTDACRQALAWKTGYTAVILRDGISQEQYLSVLTAIRESGGAVAIEADEVLLGWVPVSRAALVRANAAVRKVLHEPASREIDDLRPGRGLDALRYYNRTHSPDFEDTLEAALATGPGKFTQCIPDAENGFGDATNSGKTASDRSAHPREKKVPRLATVNSYWNSTLTLEMRGRVTVQIFRMDSTGSASQYDWTSSHMNVALNSVFDMMNYWGYQAYLRGVPLSFRADCKDTFSHYTRSFVPTPTNYEPINLSPGDAYLWVNDALSRHGYGASPVTYANVWQKNEEFNLAALSSTGGPYDHSFTIYFVYNFTSSGIPGPNHFQGVDYGAFVPNFGGTGQIVAYNANGFGPNYLWFVLRHETGHNFWACDEYMAGCSSCGPCSTWGPRPSVPNGNCAAGPYINDGYKSLCLVPIQECVMTNTANGNLCPHTVQKIGW
jgi:hypothetical protein